MRRAPSARMPSPLTIGSGRSSSSTARTVTAGDKPKGNFRLDSFSRTSPTRPTANAGWPCWSRSRQARCRRRRSRVRRRKRSRPWPTGSVRRVAAAEAARSAPKGRVVLRRLNRAEYENTVRDLLGVDVDLKDLLPADSSSERLRQRRRGAARLLLPDGAVPGSGRQGLGRGHRQRAQAADDQETLSASRTNASSRTPQAKGVNPNQDPSTHYRQLDDAVVIFSLGRRRDLQVWSRCEQFRPTARGKYRFRISAYGFQTASRSPFT